MGWRNQHCINPEMHYIKLQNQIKWPKITLHYIALHYIPLQRLHLTEEELGGLEESAGRVFAAATARSSRLSGSGLALVLTNATHLNALHFAALHYGFDTLH